MDMERCPAILREKTAIHISFNEKILEYALENWPTYIDSNKSIKDGPYYYNDSRYKILGL